MRNAHMGESVFTASNDPEAQREMERLVGWRVCKRCGRWFRYARGGAGRRPVYCSDVCRGAAEVDRQKARP